MANILGISAFYHDSAAALLQQGVVTAAAQEERFTRVKHDPSFPSNSIDFVLKQAGLQISNIDYIAFYEKPFLKFERLLETYMAFSPRGFRSFSKAMPIWIRDKLFQKKLILKEISERYGVKFDQTKLLFAEHHLSHAASAYFPSPYESAIVLTVDGVGEWATTTVSIGKKDELQIVKELHFPHSIGLLYSAFTYYIGFRVNSGEYKVMGLAPYGSPKYKDIILENLIDLKEDGSFRLEMSFFNYCTGLTMVSKKFCQLFGQPVRRPDLDPLTDFHMDIAASVQSVIEEIMLRLTKNLFNEYEIPNLCLAGGVALNCVANSKVLASGVYENIWVQPASGDAGGAVGAALAAWHQELKQPKKIRANGDGMSGGFLGPEFSNPEIQAVFKKKRACFSKLDDQALIKKTADAIARGLAIGWFQGRMEFGPRALGSRSILGDPRSATMQRDLNLKVKYRESFRPFAPSVLAEDLNDWFELFCDSPYMLFVGEVAKSKRINIDYDNLEEVGIEQINQIRSEIPAVTHLDFTARVQTVHQSTNPRFHALIKEFKEITGCGMLVNTSFNIRGEPIVCSPADAYRCFMGTELDVLVCGNYYLEKVIRTSI